MKDTMKDYADCYRLVRMCAKLPIDTIDVLLSQYANYEQFVYQIGRNHLLMNNVFKYDNSILLWMMYNSIHVSIDIYYDEIRKLFRIVPIEIMIEIYNHVVNPQNEFLHWVNGSKTESLMQTYMKISCI